MQEGSLLSMRTQMAAKRRAEISTTDHGRQAWTSQFYKTPAVKVKVNLSNILSSQLESLPNE